MAAQSNTKQRFVIHPKKFMLWLFIVSSTLFFGGITSGYIVSRGIERERMMWHTFELPPIFWATTAVLLVSSVLLQLGVWGARRGDFGRVRIALILTFSLGVLFMIGQVIAWKILYSQDVIFANGNADSYLYLITGLHMIHVFSGLIFTGVVLFRTIRGRYTAGNMVGIENCATFWHFLDLLWLYLFIFLLLNN